MNPEDPRDTIAEVLARHQPNEWGQHDGWWECCCQHGGPTVVWSPQHQADVVLAALRTGGYELVKLPEPDDPSTYNFGDTCRAAWMLMEDDGESVDVAVYRSSVEVSIPFDNNRFDPELAVVLAAAILAAAAVAEQTGASK